LPLPPDGLGKLLVPFQAGEATTAVPFVLERDAIDTALAPFLNGRAVGLRGDVSAKLA
jgi:hypothetical protein